MASPFVDVAVEVQRCNGFLKITIYKKKLEFEPRYSGPYSPSTK